MQSTRIAPLRSTGCQTCRNRKVKCDETRPVCRRCEVGKFRCLGYERTIHFIDERAREKRCSSRGVRASGPEESQPVTGTEVMTLNRSSERTLRSTPPPPKELDLSAFETTIHLSFLSQNMFSGASNTESSQSMADSWLLSSTREMDPTSTTYNAVRALGAAFFGNVLNQPDIARKGSHLYGESLHMLNRDLRNTSAVQSIETLTNAMILGLYEVGEFQQGYPLAVFFAPYSNTGLTDYKFVTLTNPSGWISHAAGLGHLVKLRGPEGFRQPLHRRILESNRVIIVCHNLLLLFTPKNPLVTSSQIMHSLLLRKRCFLEQPAWKIVPWELEPEPKPLLTQIHDILCDLPGLLEDAQSLRSLDPSSIDLERRHEFLYQRLLACFRRLFQWRRQWESEMPNASFEVATDPHSSITLNPTDRRPLFPTLLCFSELTRANEITLCNASLLVLFQVGQGISGPSFSPAPALEFLGCNPSSNPLIPLDVSLTAESIAVEICRSVEYHLKSLHQGLGSFDLLFPLRVAYRALPVEHYGREWIAWILEEIARTNGFGISRTLLERLPMRKSSE